MDGQDDDIPFWDTTEFGMFTLKLAYNILNPRIHANESKWKLVWNWKGPERIKTFCWLVLHGKLLTNVHKVKRNMATDALCARCGARETILHMVCDYPTMQERWDLLLRNLQPDEFYTSNITNCVEEYLAGWGNASLILLGIVTTWVRWRIQNRNVLWMQDCGTTEVVHEVQQQTNQIWNAWNFHEKARVMKANICVKVVWGNPHQRFLNAKLMGRLLMTLR